MTNKIQAGHSMEYANAGSAIASGDVVPLVDRCGVALTAIAATSGKGTLELEGVYEIAKDDDESFAQGDQLFFDASDSTITKTAAGNTPIGIATEVALTAAVVGRVRLQPQPKRAANVAAVATADGSDAATTEALANALKVSVNAILTSLKNAGLMKNA